MANTLPAPLDTARLLAMIADGTALTRAATAVGSNRWVIYRLKQADAQFRADLTIAEEIGLRVLIDRLATIHEEIPDPQRARLASENVRWLASKRLHREYGDRLDIDVNVKTDLGAAIAEARERVRRTRGGLVLDAEAVVETPALEPIDIFS